MLSRKFTAIQYSNFMCKRFSITTNNKGLKLEVAVLTQARATPPYTKPKPNPNKNNKTTP